MSAALDVSLNVLYVQGTRIEEDRAATDELRTASSELQITTIAGPAAALAELRRTPGWQALIVSPSIPHNETLALIASIRRDRIPIAIVPIIDDTHQEVFAAAVATGADDVLVRRGGTLVSIRESLTRIRQSPHLFPAEQRRRIVVLYAGRDPLVWNLLAQVPFVRAERAAVTPEGTCPVRRPGAGDDSLRADAVIIDEAPGDAHPLQVLKSVKAQASDVPVIVLTSAGGADIATAALELGADDTVLKTGIFRRRLIATLRRVHQRIEISAQQQETRAREERLRQIVENVPAGIMVVSGDGRVLAMNGAALQLFGASRPRDVVGRDFRDLAAEAARPDVGELIRKVTKGEPGSLDFDAVTLDGSTFGAHIDAVMLERDARGNRGLVAAIGRAGQPEASAELPALRAELERLERHYAELEEARTRERETWDAERRALLERLEATERAAAERDTLARRLEEISAELTRAGETFAAEREALEQQIRELEARTEQSSNEGALRLELERSLTQVRTELEQAIEAHAVERSGWEAIRADLEARIEELDQAHRSEHDSLVASLRSELTRLEGTLADERARWDDTRQQLEAELQRAREALWEEHRAHEATRAGYESDLASLRTQLDEARVDWETREASLRRELDDLRAEREAVLEAQQQALEEQRAAHAAERAELEAARERLTAALEVERAAWREERQAIDEERLRLAERLAEIDARSDQARREEIERERQQWAVERAELDRQLADARLELDRHAAARAELQRELDEAHGRQADLERQLDEARAGRDELERQLEDARQERERAAEALQALTDEYDATRARLEQERDEARATVERDLRAAIESELAGLRADLAEARAQADASAHALALAREDHDAAIRALEGEHEQARAGLESRIAALDNELARLREELAQRDAVEREQRAAFEREIAEAAGRAEQERARLVTLHTREQEEWRQVNESLRAERDRLADQAAGLEAALAAERERIGTLEAAVAAGRSRLDELEPALAIARSESDAARRQLADLERTLADTRRALDDANEALEAARHEIRQTDAIHREERERWLTDRRILEDRLAELEARHADAQRTWTDERGALEARIAEADTLRAVLAGLHETAAALRARHDALTAEVEGERTSREALQERLTRAEAELRDAQTQLDARLAEARAEASRDARATIDTLERQRAAAEARVRELEEEHRRLASRLDDHANEAAAGRAALQARYEEAARARARLIGIDAFGWALTAATGELLSCNDAFARLFGYVNAEDALFRTSGRPFPGLVGRPAIDAQLQESGQVNRVVSCVERVDGEPVRILEWASLVPPPPGQSGRHAVEHVILGGPASPSDEERQARRLQEVGALATAMVPELDSIVATLRDRLAALAADAGSAGLSTAERERLDRLATQARALVQQLAAFSRRQARGAATIDLREVVAAAEPVLARLAGDYVAFSTNLAPVTTFRAHRDDVDQLLTSLVTRARDLLPAGGSLVLDVRQRQDPAGEPGPVVAAVASGYGVQTPGPSPALEQLALRCGGVLTVSGEAGWNVRLEVLFPRCQRPSSPTWGWLDE